MDPVADIKRFCKKLSAYNVMRVIFEYDGEGDSGSFNTTRYLVESAPPPTTHNERVGDRAMKQESFYSDTAFLDYVRKKAKEQKTEPLFAIRDLERLADNALELLPGGWELDEGSYGLVEITIPTEKIAVTHNERITSVDTTRREY